MSETPSWPTWEDGKPVQIGEVAMSLMGPLRICSVEINGGGWVLVHSKPVFGGRASLRYVIDEGRDGEHPCREGEPCDFWDPDMEPRDVKVKIMLGMDLNEDYLRSEGSGE